MSIAAGNTIVAIIAILLFIGLPLVVTNLKQTDLETRIEALEKP